MYNRFDYSRIPPHMMDGLNRYVEYGISPGSFLTAVLMNDLWRAVECADNVNVELIPIYVAYFVNNIPANCWGSADNFSRWRGNKQYLK